MAIQELNEVQRAYINETVRPAIENMIKFRYKLAMLVDEMSNQADPILNNADTLGDGEGGTVARTDAPELTGQNVQQLLGFATTMRDQVSTVELNSLIKLAVRDVNTIVGGV